MNKLLSYFFIILILSSCSTKLTVVDYSVAPKNAKELIARVNSKNKTPEWLALKGKVNLIKDERDITLNINIKFRKDSVVWASVSAPFGIELFRTMLTPDSVYYINRTNKTYFKKPISYISSFLKTDISFQQVHEMITANPSILKNDYDIHYRDIYEIKSPNAGYFISDNYFRILYADVNEGENNLIYEFDNYIFIGEFLFPQQFSLEIGTNSKISLNYSKMVFNEKQKLHFKIPSSYVEAK
jgi:hypothetical protein